MQLGLQSRYALALVGLTVSLVVLLGGALLLRLGSIAWDKLASIELASAAWETVLDLDPGQVEAYTHLEVMFQASDEREKLDELLCWALDKSPWANALKAPRRRAELFVRLAGLREARGADADAYRAWLLLGELDPNHLEARRYFQARADTPEGAQDLFRLLERGLDEGARRPTPRGRA